MQSKDSDIFSLTLIKRSSAKRPKTSSLQRTSYNPFNIQKKYSGNGPLIKMKQLKAQAKQAQQQYLSMLTTFKQSQKCISENYKEVQKKKVSFLKLYQTKKLKNLQSTLIDECKTQRQKRESQAKQQVKRQKIEEEIKRLVTKQQKQTNLELIRQKIQKQKQRFKNKKFLKTKELFNMSRESFLAIKKQHDQSKERKTHVKAVSDVRSKHNYWKRVSEEIIILEEYEKIVKDLEQYENFNFDVQEQRAQTSQTARTSKTGFFITQKK